MTNDHHTADIPCSLVDYQALLYASPNAYLLLTPELTLVDANPAYLGMMGCSREQLIGGKVFDLFPSTDRESEQRLRNSFKRVLDTREPDTLHIVHYPLEQRNPSGHREWKERYWMVNNIPVLDERGEVGYILNHPSEITGLLFGGGAAGEVPDDEERFQHAETVHRINRALEIERRRFRQLMEQAPGFVAVGRGPEFVFELANKAYYQLVGHRDILGKTVREALPELEGQGFYELLEQVCRSGEPFMGRAMPIKIQRTPGADPVQRYLDFIYQPIFEQDGSVSGTFVQGHDVTEAHELSKEVSYQAAHDALTGLVNRREFERRLQRLIEEPSEGADQHSLLFLDLDQFKLVNDTCGHSAGDELLRHVSRVLESSIRPDDTLARLGGDEFGLLLENCPEQTAGRIAEELRKLVSEIDFSWGNRIFGCSVSIGLATFHDSEGRFDEVMVCADSACFLAKEKGRDRVQLYRHEDDDLVARRKEMDWVARLRGALQESRIVLYSQRIEPLGVESDPVDRSELLMRLRETDGAIVPPMAFIPAAERYGLMPAIDRSVVQAAFSYLHGLSAEQGQHTEFFINLSGATLDDEGFLPFVEGMLGEFDIRPARIWFELTETTAVANMTQAVDLMNSMKALGFRFALDDFGSGMSSFAYLKNLPVDCLKIDGSFIRNILDDEVDAAMVEAIARVAEVMGLRTIAEYVESREIRERLVDLGVDFAQGYGIHRPALLYDLS